MRLLAELLGAEVVVPPEWRRDDGSRRVVLFRLREHCAQHEFMGGSIAGGTEGQAEGVRDDSGEGGACEFGDRWDLRDGDRRDARVVKSPLEQSDRLLADRSSGNEEHQVDLVALEHVDGHGEVAVEDYPAVEDRPHH